MSIRGLIDEWSAAAAFDFTEGNDVSGIAYTDCAKKLEAALPTWTKITDDPDTWPEDEQDILRHIGAGQLKAGLWQVPTDKVRHHIGTSWRPLCDLDYPPETGK